MTKSLRSFLSFQGQNIYFLSIDGTYWVAIKPICDALSVNYDRQFKNLKADDILGQLLSEQTMVAADNRLRKMTCLPEKWIYGWLFSIRSDNENLKAFKRECYDVLYNHFHGTINERIDSIRIKTEAELEVERLELALLDTQAYKDLQEAKKRVKTAKKTIVRLDATLAYQLTLFA